MAYTTNQFCWHGIISTNVDKAKVFYSEAIGWSVLTFPMGETEAVMFAAEDGVPRAHLSPPPADGIPSFWENYLRVDDVDASHALALANGGAEHAPPTDIPVGRFSAVATPSGAVLYLFHEADESQSAHPASGPGAIYWTELFSSDVETDLAWLKSTFDMTIEEMPIPGGIYNILKSGEDTVGGCMGVVQPGTPSHWLSWIHVEDVDAAAARVSNHGGELLGEVMDMEGVGRMVVCKDSTSAVFGIMQPDSSGAA